jgi:hypothetical protein
MTLLEIAQIYTDLVNADRIITSDSHLISHSVTLDIM